MTKMMVNDDKKKRYPWSGFSNVDVDDDDDDYD